MDFSSSLGQICGVLHDPCLLTPHIQSNDKSGSLSFLTLSILTTLTTSMPSTDLVTCHLESCPMWWPCFPSCPDTAYSLPNNQTDYFPMCDILSLFCLNISPPHSKSHPKPLAPLTHVCSDLASTTLLLTPPLLSHWAPTSPLLVTGWIHQAQSHLQALVTAVPSPGYSSPGIMVGLYYSAAWQATLLAVKRTQTGGQPLGGTCLDRLAATFSWRFGARGKNIPGPSLAPGLRNLHWLQNVT